VTRELRNQMLAIVAPIMVSGTVMIGSATWYLASAIDSVRIATIQTTADLAARVAVTETRVSHLEQRMTERGADEATFRAEIRAAIAQHAFTHAP
jgi:hypothetical protein